jgi:hypothetical protein
METLSLLPDVVLTVHATGIVTIQHRKTAMVTETTAKRLNTWALSQLRQELSPASSLPSCVTSSQDSTV